MSQCSNYCAWINTSICLLLFSQIKCLMFLIVPCSSSKALLPLFVLVFTYYHNINIGNNVKNIYIYFIFLGFFLLPFRPFTKFKCSACFYDYFWKRTERQSRGCSVQFFSSTQSFLRAACPKKYLAPNFFFHTIQA